MKVTRDPYYVCDRCGQTIVSTGDDWQDHHLPMVTVGNVEIPILMSNNQNQRPLDLCTKCKKSFTNWFSVGAE